MITTLVKTITTTKTMKKLKVLRKYVMVRLVIGIVIVVINDGKQCTLNYRQTSHTVLSMPKMHSLIK